MNPFVSLRAVDAMCSMVSRRSSMLGLFISIRLSFVAWPLGGEGSGVFFENIVSLIIRLSKIPFDDRSIVFKFFLNSLLNS